MKYAQFKPTSFLKNHVIITYFKAFLAGAMLPLAFAPFGYSWLAMVSASLLFALWLNTSPQEGFRRGWWYGLGYFGIGASWVYVSIHQYGDTNIVLASILTFLFVSVLALFPAIQGYFLQGFFGEKGVGNRGCHILLKALIYFPTSWVFFEWLRSWVLTGFPWLQLGHSQVNSVLSGFIPLFGVFGVTAIVVFLSGCLFLAIKYCFDRAYLKAILILSIFLGGFFIGVIVKTWKWVTCQTQPYQVALVQGNVPQNLKWSKSQLIPILRLYPQLSQSLWKKNDLVIWPEAAITLPLPFSAGYIAQLRKIMRPYKVSLITGIPIQSGNSFNYYNAMLLLNKSGVDVYYKRYLVPFGEYLPLENWLKGIIGFFNLPMSDFISGNKEKVMRLENQALSVAPFVCYEIAYPNAILSVAAQSNLMVVLSNDTWFGDSLGPYQHLQIAQFAALAAGRYTLVGTNDGITAILDPFGKIVAQAPRFQQAVLQGKVYLTTGKTPWIKWGHTYLLISLGLIAIIGRISQKFIFNIRH